MGRIQKSALGLLVLVLLSSGAVQAGDPADAQRAALSRDLANMAVAAQRFFFTPGFRGGGNGAFDNSWGGVGISTMLQLTRRPTTTAGTYWLGTVSSYSISIYGEGTARGSDGAAVSVVCEVFCDSIAISYNN